MSQLNEQNVLFLANLALFKAIILTNSFSYNYKFLTPKVILVFLLLFSLFSAKADNCEKDNLIIKYDTIYQINEAVIENYQARPNPIFQLFKAKHRKNKRIAAAILAFPFPFGMVGLHRIYLGTAPHIPVVYIASLGGVIGILPFIDFCILMFDKNIDRYIENKKIFMWVE